MSSDSSAPFTMSSDSSVDDDEECYIGGYALLSPIGRGFFAEVRLARHLVTDTEVAVKIINKQDPTESCQEATILKSLNHPNITKLFQMIDTEDQALLFMEHVSGGHLLGYLQTNGPMTEEDARAMFRQMTSAVHYCHHKGIAHRDLKPENILLDDKKNIKVANFGFSTKFSSDKLHTFCGTVSYTAPEILKREPYDGRKADAWSLGVILYRMVVGKLPFERTGFEEQKQQILNGHFHIPDSMSVECEELLNKLLTVDPTRRTTVEDIMKDQWVNIGCEEALRPYSEPPGGDIEPRVIETMEKLGFKKEEVEESVSQRKYNEIMGTYMILHSRQRRMVGRTIKVRPCPAPDSNISLCATQGARALGQKSNECSSLPCCLEARVPSPPPHMERTSSLPPSLETRMFTPSTSLEFWVSAPLSSLEMRRTTDTESVEARVPTPLSLMETRTSSLPPSLETRMFTSSTSLEFWASAPLSSLEMRRTTDTESMEARVPSSLTLMETRTSSLPPSLETIFMPSPSVETRRTTATGSRESRVTVSPSRPWASITSPQVSLDGTMSIPSASLDSRVTSSLPSTGSRATTPVAHSPNLRTQVAELDVGTPASPSGPSHGQQGMARRVLRFFLKYFCCWPSMNKQHHKRKRVKPM